MSSGAAKRAEKFSEMGGTGGTGKVLRVPRVEAKSAAASCQGETAGASSRTPWRPSAVPGTSSDLGRVGIHPAVFVRVANKGDTGYGTWKSSEVFEKKGVKC